MSTKENPLVQSDTGLSRYGHGTLSIDIDLSYFNQNDTFTLNELYSNKNWGLLTW